MPDAQATRMQEIYDRIDFLAISNSNFPEFSSGRHFVAEGGDFLTWELLARRQTKNIEPALLRQRSDGAFANELPRAKNGHAVADQLYLAKHVRVEEDGFSFRFQFLQNAANLAPANRVYAVGGLIQEDDLGVVQQCLSNADALFHSLGVRTQLVVFSSLETDQVQHRVDAPQEDLARHAKQGTIEFEQAVTGVILGKAVVFGKIADAFPHRRSTGRLTEQARLPRCCLGNAQQDFNEGCLARAVLPQQTEDLAGVHAQRETSERLDLAILLHEIVGFD